MLIPDAKTLVMLNDSNKNGFTLSFDSWFTVKKPVDTELEFQVDLNSAQNVTSSIAAHQSLDRIGVLLRGNNISFG